MRNSSVGVEQTQLFQCLHSVTAKQMNAISLGRSATNTLNLSTLSHLPCSLLVNKSPVRFVSTCNLSPSVVVLIGLSLTEELFKTYFSSLKHPLCKAKSFSEVWLYRSEHELEQEFLYSTSSE